MSGFGRNVFMSLMALTFAASTSLAQNSPNNTPASELLAFHVKDHEFKPIEVAPWVQQVGDRQRRRMAGVVLTVPAKRNATGPRHPLPLLSRNRRCPDAIVLLI